MKKTIKQIKESRISAIKRHFVRGLITGVLSSTLVVYITGNYPTNLEEASFVILFACLIGFWNGTLSASYKAYTLSI